MQPDGTGTGVHISFWWPLLPRIVCGSGLSSTACRSLSWLGSSTGWLQAARAAHWRPEGLATGSCCRAGALAAFLQRTQQMAPRLTVTSVSLRRALVSLLEACIPPRGELEKGKAGICSHFSEAFLFFLSPSLPQAQKIIEREECLAPGCCATPWPECGGLVSP